MGALKYDVCVSGNTRNFFVGASRGQNTILRGQKSKNLLKITDFGHFFYNDWGGQSLQLGGGECPYAPLDATTGVCNKKRAPFLSYLSPTHFRQPNSQVSSFQN